MLIKHPLQHIIAVALKQSRSSILIELFIYEQLYVSKTRMVFTI